MDNRAVAKSALFLTAATLVAAGCGNSANVPAHSATEDKAIAELKSMTPQQQIDRIQKGPMPASAKESMIKKIKDANGMK